MTTTRTTWYWQDHWNHAPPAGWDGRHELSVCGYGTNFDTAGVILACSCGRSARASKDSDEGGPVSLTELNEQATAHLEDVRDAGVRA